MALAERIVESIAWPAAQGPTVLVVCDLGTPSGCAFADGIDAARSVAVGVWRRSVVAVIVRPEDLGDFLAQREPFRDQDDWRCQVVAVLTRAAARRATDDAMGVPIAVMLASERLYHMRFLVEGRIGVPQEGTIEA